MVCRGEEEVGWAAAAAAQQGAAAALPGSALGSGSEKRGGGHTW